MAVRKNFGSVMDEVRLRGETFVLERAGKPMAKIVPVDAEAEARMTARQERLQLLTDMAGIGAASPRDNDLTTWVQRERADR